MKETQTLNIGHSAITNDQKVFIDELKIPSKLNVITDNLNDEINVLTSENIWRYRSSGYNIRLDFNQFNPYLSKLLKYYVFEKAQNGSILHNDALNHFKVLNTTNLTFKSYKDWLETNVNIVHAMQWYGVKKLTQMLCRMELPGFKDEDRERLLTIPHPNHRGSYLVYQNLENAFPESTKRLIVLGIMKASAFISSIDDAQLNDRSLISDQELQDWMIFSILYYTGARAVQLSKMIICDFTIHTVDEKTGLIRYDLLMPYAKKKKVAKKRPKISLPMEFGPILEAYIKRNKLSSNSPLIQKKIDLSSFIYPVIKRSLFRIQPKSIQQKIVDGEFIQPHLTPIDFRHNIGHSMAMTGASAIEISYILGHTSTGPASYYILTTPQLSIIKYHALGENSVWENMVNLLMTNYIIDIDEWTGKKISGIAGGQLHLHIGGCDRKEPCHLTKVRSCYGCLYFRPSSDSEKHKKVLKALEFELLNSIEISEKSGNSRNPIVKSMAFTKIQIQIVINRTSRATN